MVIQIQNWLSPLDFQFSLSRIKHVAYSVKSANIPGISISPIAIPTPIKPINFYGTSMEFNDLQITFIVDENMTNWNEIYQWMKGLAPSPNFNDTITMKKSKDKFYSDATLTIMNSTKNPNITFTFYNLTPITLNDIQLNSADSDVVYATCDITFKYDYFEMKKTT